MKHLTFIITIIFLVGCTKSEFTRKLPTTLLPPPLIICDGNSRTAQPDGAYGSGLAYPEYLAELTGYHVINAGAGGQTIVQMIEDAQVQIDPLYQPGAVLIVWEYSNQLYYWGYKDYCYDQLREYISGRREVGFKIIVATDPHRTLEWNKHYFTPHGDTWDQYNASLDTINQRIRDQWPTFADGILDFAADPAFQNENFSTKQYPDSTGQYYFDGVHFTELGRRKQAEMAKAAIEKL